MRRLRAALLRLRGVFGRDRLEREMADELDAHVQMHIADSPEANSGAQDRIV